MQTGGGGAASWARTHLQLDRGLGVMEQVVLEALQTEPLALAANDDVRQHEAALLRCDGNLISFVQAQTVAAGVGTARECDAPSTHQAHLLEAQPCRDRKVHLRSRLLRILPRGGTALVRRQRSVPGIG